MQRTTWRCTVLDCNCRTECRLEREWSFTQWYFAMRRAGYLPARIATVYEAEIGRAFWSDPRNT